MFKEKILPISIFCLCISLIISATILGKAITIKGERICAGLCSISQNFSHVGSNTNSKNSVDNNPNYDFTEACHYLRLTEEELLNLVNNKGSNIPYIKIKNAYIFNKVALDKWLETCRCEIN